MGNEQPPPSDTASAPEEKFGYDTGVHPLIAHLSVEQLTVLHDSIRDLIPLRMAGIEYADGRVTQLASLAGALLSLGVALIPLSSIVVHPAAQYALFAFGVLIALTGLTTWVLYLLQVNYPYPFVQVEGSWKWFYHQALPKPSEFGPTIPRLLAFRFRHPMLDAARSAVRQSKPWKAELAQVSEQFVTFGGQVAGLSDAKIDATQDLRQLYRLHINERYKNLFLSQLRTWLTVGMLISVVGAGLTAVISSYVIERTDQRVAESQVTAAGVVVTANWTPTGRVRANGIGETDVQYRLEVELKNNSDVAATIESLVVLGRDGRPIPAEIDLLPASVHVAGHSAQSLVGYLWIAAYEATNVNTVTAR